MRTLSFCVVSHTSVLSSYGLNNYFDCPLLLIAFSFLLPLSRLLSPLSHPTFSSSYFPLVLTIQSFLGSESLRYVWVAILFPFLSVFSRQNIACANQIPNTYNVSTLGDDIPILRLP